MPSRENGDGEIGGHPLAAMPCLCAYSKASTNLRGGCANLGPKTKERAVFAVHSVFWMQATACIQKQRVAFPCNIRREAWHFRVMLEGRHGIPLQC